MIQTRCLTLPGRSGLEWVWLMRNCYSLDLLCPSKTHVLKVWPSTCHLTWIWGNFRSFRRFQKAVANGMRLGIWGHVFERDIRTPVSPLLWLPGSYEADIASITKNLYHPGLSSYMSQSNRDNLPWAETSMIPKKLFLFLS